MSRQRRPSRPGELEVRPSAFGQYSLIAKLGSGGMGVVHLAVMGVGERAQTVVVKRLHPHLLDEAYQAALFRDECRLATRFDHPNVARTTDVGAVGDVHYLAMEYLEGRSLLQILRARRAGKRRRIPPAVLCRIICDVLAGLHYAHELSDEAGQPLGVIHRDVSPGNVFVTSDGTSKLLDFGVAKAATQKHQTKVGTLKGKMSYLAPEQLAGDSFDHRVDIWATGVVLLEALTGKSPFAAESDVDVLQRLMDLDLDGYIDRLISLRWPASILETARIALKRNPRERFRSAREMGATLSKYSERVAATHADVARFLEAQFHEEFEAERRIVQDALARSGGMRLSTPGAPPPVGAAPGSSEPRRARRETPSTIPVISLDGPSHPPRERSHTEGTVPVHPLPPPMTSDQRLVSPRRDHGPMVRVILAAAAAGVLFAWLMPGSGWGREKAAVLPPSEPPRSVPVPLPESSSPGDSSPSRAPRPRWSPPLPRLVSARPALRPTIRPARRPDRRP